jgi:general stress protein YciG
MAEKSLHQKKVEAGRAGGLAEHECRGRECTHPSHREGGSESEMTTHEKRVEAGRKGGLAEHECRGRECTHPSHKGGSRSK